MTSMLKSFARLLPFAGLLGVLLVDAGPAYANSVSAVASSWYGLGPNPCPAGQTTTGDTTASASAQCAIGGDLSTATASAMGGTLASEVLSASAYAFNSDRNVYASAGASFTLDDLVVVGTDVPGFADFIFGITESENPPSFDSGPEFANVDLFDSWPVSPNSVFEDGWNLIENSVPYIPGVPFSFTATLYVGALAGEPGEAAQVSATFTLVGVDVDDQNGPVPGATVEEIPEPASLLLVTAGALLLATLGVRRRRSITSLF